VNITKGREKNKCRPRTTNLLKLDFPLHKNIIVVVVLINEVNKFNKLLEEKGLSFINQDTH
jgi:hypothetical protein